MNLVFPGIISCAEGGIGCQFLACRIEVLIVVKGYVLELLLHAKALGELAEIVVMDI